MRKLERIDQESLSSNPRANYNSWLKYEPIVRAAFNQHPKTYVYAPASMSPATVASRLRDAIRGFLAFGYTYDLSAVDIARGYDEIIIKHDRSCVYIGQPQDVKSVIRGEQRSPDSSSNLIFTTLSFEEVSAFTLLLSNARILGPIIIKNPPDLTLLPQRPNVEMLQRPDGSIALL